MIELKDISYKYQDGTEALRAINLSIKEGEKMVVAGANGAGKSTLFMILNGILRPSSGSYLFDGKEIKYTKKELYNLHKTIGVVFQEPDSQIFSASVYEEVAFGPLNLQLPESEVKARVDEALKTVDIENLKDRPAHLLSYGQKKRVTIASVLSMNPKVIIFDEPTAGLDPVHASEIIALLDKLHQSGKTIIISTHDMNLAYQWADRIILLNNGKIVGDDTSAKVFDNQEVLHRCGLELPLILQIFNGFKEADMTPPKDINQLLNLIKSAQCVE